MRLIALAGLAAFALRVAGRRRVARGTRRILRVSRVVSDLDRSEAFYRDGLGFHRVWAGPLCSATASLLLPGAEAEVRRMRLGAEEIELVRWTRPGAPYPAGSRADDRWFQHLAIVSGDMDAAARRLLALAPDPISTNGPQELPGGVAAFKFRDPDGHPLELIRFPPGQNAARWQRRGATLGIDHSALSVESRGQALRFYRRLGFRKAGETFNHGPAQAALDGVPGATARVVSLRLPGPGPGLELLAYVPPGRPMPPHPANAAMTDWVTIETRTGRSRLLRDPDGHLLLLTAR